MTSLAITPFGTYNTAYLDEYGNAIERTPMTHPYNYDGYVTRRFGNNEEVNHTIYSDRLLQHDYEKTRKLMQKHFGNQGDYYSQRPPKQIAAFLSEWYDNRPLKLVLIMEYCNQSSGYPVWRFDVNFLDQR